MAAATRVFIAEPMPLLAQRLCHVLASHGIDAELNSLPRPGLWFLSLDGSQVQTDLLAQLDDLPDTSVILSSARDVELAEASRIYSCVVAMLPRPFNAASLLTHLRDTTSAVQQPARTVSGVFDTSMELDAAESEPVRDQQPEHTVEVPAVRIAQPAPAHDSTMPPEDAAVGQATSADVEANDGDQLTIAAFADAGADLLPLWAELPRAERLEVLTEFLQRLARQLGE